jgi:small ligand-binding sensory domain FIST
VDPARAAVEAAGAAMRSGGLDGADLALVFATTPHGPAFGRVTRHVAESCGTRDVVGCSALGVLAGDDEIEADPAVAVLALRGDLRARRFFVPLVRGEAGRAAEQVADAVAGEAAPGDLLLLFADTYHLEPEPFLDTLARRLPGVRVVGGGASEDGSVGQVSVFAGDAVSSQAVAGVLLRATATVGVTHAVRRVGPVRRITRARGNVVLELDGRPAAEAFASVVPKPLLEDPRRALTVVLAGLPLGEDEYLARHLLGFDAERGTVAVAAPVDEGGELFFGVRDRVGARDDLQRMLARQASAWPTPPAAALYVCCVGRGRAFHGVAGLETAYLRQALGSVPVVGFFSGAEIAPGGGVPRLHQYTGVLAMLGPHA